MRRPAAPSATHGLRRFSRTCGGCIGVSGIGTSGINVNGPGSEQDDAIPLRQMTRTQRRRYLRRVSRERAVEGAAMLPHDGTVTACASHDQDDPVDAAITPLGLAPSLDRLDVTEPRLHIDPDRSRAVQPDVPGAVVTRPADEDLRADPERLPDLLPEAPDQAQLAGVADRRALRVCPEAQPQPKSARVACELVDADVGPFMTLRPADP